MAASLNPNFKTNSVGNRTFGPLGPLVPEGEPALRPQIPRAQFRVPESRGDRPAKKFSMQREEISEATLSEGFKWGPNKTPQLGKYFQKQCSNLIDMPPSVPQDSNREIEPSNSNTKVRGNPHQKGFPFDLPELGLHAEPLTSRKLDKRNLIGTKLPQHQNESSLQEPKSAICVPHQETTSPPPSQMCSRRASPGRLQILEPVRKDSMPQILAPRVPPDNSSSSSLEVPVEILDNAEILPSTSQVDNDVVNSLKLPIERSLRNSQAYPQSRQGSRCGDLEGPKYRSPRTKIFQTSSRKKAGDSRYLQSTSSSHHGVDTPSIRSHAHSRSSNISLKRSAQKRYVPTDSERKRNAMVEVAQCWNDFVRIADDEKDKAGKEIQGLHDLIEQQSQNLKKSSLEIRKRDKQAQEAMKHYKDIEENSLNVATENKRLIDQMKGMKADLEGSKQHISILTEKSRTYSIKLDEAISEQKSFYEQSLKSHSTTLKEVEMEGNQRRVGTDAIEAALEKNRKKREEMQKCIDSIRDEGRFQNLKKDQAIATLEANLEAQNEALNRERTFSEQLNRQLDAQIKLQSTMVDVESRVQSLLAQYQQSSKRAEETEITTLEMAFKIDQILEQIIIQAGQAPIVVELDPAIDRLEKKIASRFMPGIRAVISGQETTGESVSRLRTEISNQFEAINLNIKKQTDDMLQNGQSEESFRQQALAILERVDNTSGKCSTFCSDTGAKIAKWLDNQQSLENFELPRHVKLTEQLEERESTINALETKVQLLTEDYAAKVEHIRQSMLLSNEASKTDLQHAIATISEMLSKRFDEEKEKSCQNLIQVNESRTALQLELDLVKKELATINFKAQPEVHGIAQKLQDDQRLVAALEKKVVEYEQGTAEIIQLRDRWHNDIQAIGVLKDQLRGMSERIPYMENLEAGFKDMKNLGHIITTASRYLQNERVWVNQHLHQDKSEDPQHGIDILVSARPIKADNSLSSAQSNTIALQDSGSCHPESLTNPTKRATSSHYDSGIDPRKVVVHSPAGDSRSPSPPPSVEQEQLRRREATTPRSILRSRARVTKTPLNHTQHHRPVESISNSPTTSNRQDFVEQIRSKFIKPAKGSTSGFTFITVEEFEKGIQPKDSQPDVTDMKRRLLTSDLSLGPPAKRYKAEGEEPAQPVPRPALTSSCPHLMTYSKKPCI